MKMNRHIDSLARAGFALATTLIACLLPLTSCTTAQENITTGQQDARFDSRVLIIFYDKEVGDKPLLESLSTYDAELVYSYEILGGIAINIPPDKDILEAIEYFKSVKGVLSVERDRKVELMHQSGLSPVKTMQSGNGNQ